MSAIHRLFGFILCALILLAIVSRTSFASTTYSSGSTTISSNLSGAPPVVIIEGTASVDVTGSIHASTSGLDNTDPALLARNSASVLISGGTVINEGSGSNGTKSRAGVRLLDNASLTLSSGMIEGDGSGQDLDRAGVLAEGNSQVLILGGQVSAAGSGIASDFAGILAQGNSQVSILGGQILGGEVSNPDFAFDAICSGVLARGSAQIRISGGSLDTGVGLGNSSSRELDSRDTGIIIVFGSGFNYPYGPIVPLSGTLTGTLSDGSSIEWIFARDLSASIVLSVPEPSSLVLAALGIASGLLMLRRRT